MVEMNRFGILGGDKRQIYLAQSIAADGYQVYACGFDEDVEMKRVVKVSFDELTDTCGLIILPLPVTQDGKYLNMPFSKEKFLLDDTFAEKMVDKQVFGGALNRLKTTSTLWYKIAMYDYSMREEFAVQNAVPTAEGAIMIVMELSEGTINGSNCLVTGYGRIGKVLSEILKGLGANVTVSARKPADLAWIQLNGYQAVQTSQLADLSGNFDFVFNTIPSFIFTRKVLSRHHKDTLFIELASTPGGFDKEAVSKLGLKLIPALSLPGKVAPRAAGNIIKDTIYNIMEE